MVFGWCIVFFLWAASGGPHFKRLKSGAKSRSLKRREGLAQREIAVVLVMGVCGRLGLWVLAWRRCGWRTRCLVMVLCDGLFIEQCLIIDQKLSGFDGYGQCIRLRVYRSVFMAVFLLER